MSVTVAGIEFDRVRYDASSDVLYLHRGRPGDAVAFDESPEGHHLRFDAAGHLVGITLVRPLWLLENAGEITISLPETVSLRPEALNGALAVA
jgi:uncharacterized protein YuzE